MKNETARLLLEIGAIQLRTDPPFTWTSGRLAPVYCDNRLTMSFPDVRIKIARAFATKLKENNWHPDVIAGTATAGIPHAAWLAGLLNLPMVYIRGAAKSHGKENRIEGLLEPGKKVLLVEDLISTGGSSLSAAEAITGISAKLIGIAAIFDYGLDVSKENFGNAGVDYFSLTNFNELLSQALEQGVITPADKAIVSDWQKNPSKWSVLHGGAE